jgi:MFS family permease
VKNERPAVSKYAILGLLWIAYLLNYVDRQMAFSWFPVLRQEVSFSETQLGLIGAVFLWSYSICAPFGGRISDLFSRRVIIQASLAGWSIATIATAFSRSPGTFLFWRGVVGVTEGFYMPTAAAILATVFGSRRKGKAMAAHGSAQFAGIALGGWLGGLLAQTWDWRAACYTMGLAGLFYGVVLAWKLRPGEPDREGPRASAPERFEMSGLLVAMAAAYFLICAMLWMLYAWLPDTIHSRFGLSLARSGLNATLFLQISSAAGLLGGGVLGDWAGARWASGRCYLVAAGLLVATPFASAIFLAGSLPVLRACSIGFGLFTGIMLSNVIPAAFDLAPAGRYGQVAGSMTLVGGFGGGVATLAAGALRARIDVSSLMSGAALAGSLAAVILALTVRNHFKEPHLTGPLAAIHRA